MNFFDRIKRLWELSATVEDKVHTITFNTDQPGVTNAIPNESTVATTGYMEVLSDPKPQGAATIVDMSEPLDVFDGPLDAEHEGEI